MIRGCLKWVAIAFGSLIVLGMLSNALGGGGKPAPAPSATAIPLATAAPTAPRASATPRLTATPRSTATARPSATARAATPEAAAPTAQPAKPTPAAPPAFLSTVAPAPTRAAPTVAPAPPSPVLAPSPAPSPAAAPTKPAATAMPVATGSATQVPSKAAGIQTPGPAGQWVTSSYQRSGQDRFNAQYYYHVSDPRWHDLSERYRVWFATEEDLLRAFPDRVKAP